MEIRGTLSAFDQNNAAAPILNPFYDKEYRIINKMTYKMWIEAEIQSINLTSNLRISLTAAIVYVTSGHNPSQLHDVTNEYHTKRTFLRAYVNRPEIISQSTDQCLNTVISSCTSFFLPWKLAMLTSRVKWWNCFTKIWCILLLCKWENNDLQC